MCRLSGNREAVGQLLINRLATFDYTNRSALISTTADSRSFFQERLRSSFNTPIRSRAGVRCRRGEKRAKECEWKQDPPLFLPRFVRLCSVPLGMKIGSPTFHATVLPAISTRISPEVKGTKTASKECGGPGGSSAPDLLSRTHNSNLILVNYQPPTDTGV